MNGHPSQPGLAKGLKPGQDRMVVVIIAVQHHDRILCRREDLRDAGAHELRPCGEVDAGRKHLDLSGLRIKGDGGMPRVLELGQRGSDSVAQFHDRCERPE